MAPQQIGQFTIVAELAPCEGGMVYKATDPKGKTVALRTLSLEAPGAAEAVPRFRAAAKAASGLSSPNVAGIFGGGEGDGFFFVAVEFVEGVKLSTTLAKGEPMPMSEVLDLSRQVCSGLDHAHSKGIVHPELKPTNIIVEWDGTAKIMDFGVPRKHASDHMSEAMYYLSPEEARGEPLTPRSNLFSWGAILYQLVSGHKPFNASDAATLRHKIAEEAPVAPEDLNPDVPVRVGEIILKALAKAPGERYASGAELVNDLENYKSAPAAAPKSGVQPAAAAPAAAGTQIWTPSSEIRKAMAPSKPPAPAKPAPPPAPPAAAAPASKPQRPAAPAPAKAAPPPPPAAAAPAPKQERPPAAAAKPAAPRNPLIYAIGGLAALLLLAIVAGVFWMRRAPAQPQAVATAPAPQPSAVVPPPTTSTAPPPEPQAAAPTTPARGSKRKKEVAAPVEVAPATGGLSLDSSPQGAEVQIDGRHESGWVTPFTAAGLTVGSHTVTFSKPGYTAASRPAQVAAGQNAPVNVQLAELAATLAVNSNPAGAAITLDGKGTGKVTPAQLIVAKGSHAVALHKEGYLEASGTVQTAPGQTAQFSPTLKQTGSTENIKTVGKLGGLFGGGQENQGRVSVRTNPKGAQVRVNGQPVKKTTPVDFYLDPGSYELSLTLDGYKSVSKVVDVVKGGKLTVDETLTH